VNVYFAGYSIRAFWSTHRLEPVLGKKQYGRRAMVFLSVAVWVAILVYAYLPQSHTKFAQDTCRGSSAAEAVFLLAPIVIVIAAASQGPTGIFLAFLFLLVPILIVVSWTIAIVRKRKEIWPPGEPYRPKFGKVW
jgi:heme/copper-type cytochrome/quinol oxidase subunit 2